MSECIWMQLSVLIFHILHSVWHKKIFLYLKTAAFLNFLLMMVKFSAGVEKYLYVT